MSDNVPFEIQVEIMKRLPIESLIQFRTVSKSWKSLIDSPHFIADYSSQRQHLLVRYDIEVGVDIVRKYVSIVDDDSFPEQRVCPTLPPLVKKLKNPYIIGYSHGLLCLDSKYCDGPFPGMDVAVIWNISIRKAVAVVLPNVPHNKMYTTVLGFGVRRETCDPMIVKIRQISWGEDVESISCIPAQVEVFTLSAGDWRSPYGSNLPRKSIRFRYPQVVIDGFIYWIATDVINTDGRFRSCNLIISFDMTSEEFKEVNLPDCLAHSEDIILSISNLRESLVVFESDVEDNPVSVVWRMEDGVSKSFTKLFTIYTPNLSVLVGLEFRKSGEPILETLEHPLHFSSSLVVYEPDSKHISSVGMNGLSSRFSVHRYMERLLLLDHPNFIIYNEGKRYTFKVESEDDKAF